MTLDPQYSGSGGGLYPASSQSQIPAPVGVNRIEGVPAPSSVGVDENLELKTGGGRSPVSGAGNTGLQVVLWGDSGVHDSQQRLGVTSDTGNDSCRHDGAGLATYTGTSPHQGYTGARFWIVNVEDDYWYGQHRIETVISPTSFTFRVDPRATLNVRSKAAAVPNSTVTLTASWRFARNNSPCLAFGQAGVIPGDIVNLGANSQTATSMAWHVDRDLSAYPDHKLWICATVGANDVRVGNGGVASLKAAIEQAKARLLSIQAAGKIVLYLGWQPNDTRDVSKDKTPITLLDGALMAGTDGVAKAAALFDSEMSRWCSVNGIAMISQYRAMTDPTNAVGYARNNYLLSDGAHVGRKGARAMAPIIAAWLAQNGYFGAFQLAASQVDRKYDTASAEVNRASNQLFRNPLLLTGSPQATHVTLASSGNLLTPTASIVARSAAADGDDYGNNQQVVWATTGATTKDQDGKTTFALTASDVLVGGKLQAAMKVRNTAQSNFSGYTLVLTVTMSNGENCQVASVVSIGSGTDNVALDDTDLINEVIYTPVLDVPNDSRTVTSAVLVLTGYVVPVAGSTGSYTQLVGRPTVRCWFP